MSSGGIAAVVLGVVIVVIAAVLITIFIMRRRAVGSQGYSLHDSSKGFGNALYDKHQDGVELNVN